jgi:hypothetical protein
VSRWRALLRKYGMPPGDDQDWQAVTTPLRPAPIVVTVPPPPPLPPEFKGKAVLRR